MNPLPPLEELARMRRPTPILGPKNRVVMDAAPRKTSKSTAGDGQTADLVQRAYATLHHLAAHYLDRERVNHTLQPTALVHEAFLKLAGRGEAAQWKSKTHFQAVAASAMRQILVDYARRRATRKRGGDMLRITLLPDVELKQQPELDLLALEEALQDLARFDERKCRVVELRFFGGLTCEEAAKELGVSPKTAESDWYFARAWLRDRLNDQRS